MLVVTYHHAYVPGRTSLCERCSSDPDVRAALPTLGPVHHGAHDGVCDCCRADQEAVAAWLADAGVTREELEAAVSDQVSLDRADDHAAMLSDWRHAHGL